MAYSLETSSVKTIVPGAEVSGFCDVVARQKINEVSGEVPQLSAGEGIAVTTVDGKTVITNNISAGSNISLVYDMETNTYRIDGQAGGPDPASAVFSESARIPTLGLSYTSGVKISGGNETFYYKTIASFNTYISAVSLNGPYVTYLTGDSDVPTDLHSVNSEHWYNIITSTKSVNDNVWNWNQTFNTVYSNSANWGGHTYTGVAPIQVNNTTDEISITGESISAGPGIDMFSSGGYVVISSNGGNPFPITGTNGTTGFTANMDCSSMMLTTGASPAGGYVKQTVRGVQYEAYPATDVSASWYNIINATNNRSNCYCIRFTNDMTAASLEDYSAYDKVTVVHSNEYTPDCMLYWDGNTKVFPSGLYCELVKGTNDQNQTDWFFTTSGWINNVEWDWD